MRTEINLMGRLTVQRNGNVHHLSSPQARVAFARLALAGPNGVLRDELGETIWPFELPATWASALRSLISRLRTFVGSWRPEIAEPIVLSCGRYVLDLGPAADEEIVVDVRRAHNLVAAARTALADEANAEAAAFVDESLRCLRFQFMAEHDGEWVAEQRDVLTALRIAAMELGYRAAMAEHDHPRAVRIAKETIAVAPDRESAYRDLMSAHKAVGNRAEALHEYRRLQTILSEELGVDPSPETELVYLDLLGRAARPTGSDSSPADSRSNGRSAPLGSSSRGAAGRAAASSQRSRRTVVTARSAPGRTGAPRVSHAEVLGAVSVLLRAGALQPIRTSSAGRGERHPGLLLHDAVAKDAMRSHPDLYWADGSALGQPAADRRIQVPGVGLKR